MVESQYFLHLMSKIYKITSIKSYSLSMSQIFKLKSKIKIWFSQKIEFSCVIEILTMKLLKIRISYKPILFLGGTIKNATLWFSWTHWILKNHRKHLNEYFHFFLGIHLLI